MWKNGYADIQKFVVATSDATLSDGGPEIGDGTFAITSLPSSIVRAYALLKFPSSFVMRTHFVSLPNSEAA